MRKGDGKKQWDHPSRCERASPTMYYGTPLRTTLSLPWKRRSIRRWVVVHLGVMCLRERGGVSVLEAPLISTRCSPSLPFGASDHPRLNHYQQMVSVLLVRERSLMKRSFAALSIERTNTLSGDQRESNGETWRFDYPGPGWSSHGKAVRVLCR